MLSDHHTRLLTAWSEIIRPARRRHADEWAEENVEFPATAPEPGRYSASRTPYVVPIMRAFESTKYKTIVVCMGSQMGKTLSFMIIIGRLLDDDPVPVIYVGPDRVFVEDKVSPDIVAMLGASKSLRKKTLWGKRQKKTKFTVNGAKLRLAWAGSASQLASESAGLVLIDERDRMRGSVQGEGDVVKMARARLFAYSATGKLGVISTPLVGTVATEVDPMSGIERWSWADPAKLESPTWRLWQAGTRAEWAWPCPHCKQWFIPRLSLLRYTGDADPTSADVMTASRTAHVLCPSCGVLLDDEVDKARMNERGRFVCPGQMIDKDGNVLGAEPDTATASFWVSGLASPFVSWGDRAAELVGAIQSGDQNEVQTVTNTGFGELFAVRGDAPKFGTVLDCRLPYKMGQLPHGVQRIAMTVDVQKRGVYFVIRGWGARFESWLLRYGYLAGDTDQPEVWDSLEAEVRAEIAPGIGINMVLIDSGYRPGDKWRRPDNEIYAFCRRFNKMFCRPVKGRETMAYGKHLTTTDGDVDYRGKPRKFRGLLLHLLNTDYYKTQIHERISRSKEILGGWHLPEDATDEYAKQIVAETRVETGGKFVWQAHGANHYLDCEMMNWAAAELMQVHTLTALPPVEHEEEEAEAVPLVKPPVDPPTPARPAARRSRYIYGE